MIFSLQFCPQLLSHNENIKYKFIPLSRQLLKNISLRPQSHKTTTLSADEPAEPLHRKMQIRRRQPNFAHAPCETSRDSNMPPIYTGSSLSGPTFGGRGPSKPWAINYAHFWPQLRANKSPSPAPLLGTPLDSALLCRPIGKLGPLIWGPESSRIDGFCMYRMVVCFR